MENINKLSNNCRFRGVSTSMMYEHGYSKDTWIKNILNFILVIYLLYARLVEDDE